MHPPSVLQALRLSANAVSRSLWLVPLAFALAWAGTLLWAPLELLPGAMAARGLEAGEALDGGGGSLAGALAALLAPRTLLTGLGLGLGALLLRGALRVLWLGGALATLGEALSGRGGPAFAAGAVWAFPRMLATWLLGVVAEAVALGIALLAGASVLGLAGRLEGRGGGLLALSAAGAATAALLLLLLTGLLAEAALARAALRAERPLQAWHAALVRVGRRPSAFLAAALGVGSAALVLGGSVRLAANLAFDLVAPRLPPLLLLVPELGLAAFGAMVVALFELWRLGAVAALACHAEPGE